jgi:hypothetical protein
MPQTKTKMVKAKEAVVITVGARPPVYKTAIVRNRHMGMLVEVQLHPPEGRAAGSRLPRPRRRVQGRRVG